MNELYRNKTNDKIKIYLLKKKKNEIPKGV